MYSPQHYNDYVTSPAKPVTQPPSSSKQLLAFFERGEVPPDVTDSLQGAFAKFQKQRQGLMERFRKTPKKPQ
jgi:hypothetical protein